MKVALKNTGFQLEGTKRYFFFMTLANSNRKIKLKNDLINCSCQNEVSRAMSFIKASCNDKMMIPVINKVSYKKGESTLVLFNILNFIFNFLN